MDKFLGYNCSICDKEFASDYEGYVCDVDDGNLDVVLDYQKILRTNGVKSISDEESHWRYLPLLPVGDPGFYGSTLRSVGWTPVFSPTALRENLGLKHLFIKDESSNPTASFKDRASALVIARAIEISAEVFVTASTGNAGAALAGMAAAVGQKSVIFAPKSAPKAKIAQLLIYGSQVYLVDGSYDDAFDLSVKAANEFGWYCRNTGFNPFTAEGKKTAAFEIWEQVISKNPDFPTLNIFISVGDGNIISGIYKGFYDLKQLGMIDEMPRLFGVQAVGSAAIADAFINDRGITPVSANTIADSISVDLPRDGYRAMRVVKDTGGQYLTVSDDEILEAIKELGEVGIFSEPAAATAYAGLKHAVLQNIVDNETPVLVLNTGSGLKDVGAALRAVKSPPVIAPSLSSVIELINK